MNSFNDLEIRERLVAKQAVLTLRAFRRALRAVPPDQRMEALNQAVRLYGHEHLRVMMAAAIAAQRPANSCLDCEDAHLTKTIQGFGVASAERICSPRKAAW